MQTYIKNQLFCSRAIMLLVFVGVALMTGCSANWNSAYRTTDYAGGGKGVLIDIKQRAILSSKVGEQVFCAEPSPDSLSSYAAALNVSYKDIAEASGGVGESAAFVGLRTQTIQLLRDSLYRLCESYMSGVIDRTKYAFLMSRYQKNMVALLAIEQLTGAARPQPIYVNSPEITISNDTSQPEGGVAQSASTTTIKGSSVATINPHSTVSDGRISVVAGVVQTIVGRILDQTQEETTLFEFLPSSNGSTPLHSAARDGHLKLVDLYLADYHEAINILDKESRTPLHLAAFYSDSPKVVSILIKAGAGVDIQDIDGETPLHLAVKGGNKKIVDALVKVSVDVNIQDIDGATPLYLAVKREIAEALIKAGADVDIQDRNGKTPLYWAVSNGNKELADALIKAGAEVNIQDRNGETFLHLAVNDGNKEIVDALIKASVDVNIQDRNGATPLHLAIWGGYKEIVDALIKASVDVNIQDINGATPLHLAVIDGNKEIAEALIKAVADVDIQDRNGATPKDLACKSNLTKYLFDCG